MTDLRTAAQQALEVLEDWDSPVSLPAITALRTALAQEQAKPQGCDHCNHPLYAATKCRVCGRVTEQAEPVEPVACFIGAKGSAFDLPTTKRAYTYAKQPGNLVASKLGLACNAAAWRSAGDSIDRGLTLLQELQKAGFGVFDLGAEYTAPPQQAEPVEPVAWRITDGEGDWDYRTELPEDWSIQWSARYGRKYEPLYTAPPQRKPLTDEEISDLSREMVKGGKSVDWLCRIIERAHGIGDNP